jgi:YD repeat-containing protein
MRYKKNLFILTVILIAAFSGQAFSATYTYDNLNRLINVDYGNGTVANYTYDAAGNMTSMVAITPLSGAVAINGGATSTTSTSVTLTLSATDTLSTVSQMRFSRVGCAVRTIK